MKKSIFSTFVAIKIIFFIICFSTLYAQTDKNYIRMGAKNLDISIVGGLHIDSVLVLPSYNLIDTLPTISRIRRKAPSQSSSRSGGSIFLSTDTKELYYYTGEFFRRLVSLPGNAYVAFLLAGGNVIKNENTQKDVIDISYTVAQGLQPQTANNVFVIGEKYDPLAQFNTNYNMALMLKNKPYIYFNNTNDKVQVGINTLNISSDATLEVLGNIKASSLRVTSHTLSSDQRLKKDITPIKNPLKMLSKIKPYTFFFKEGALNQTELPKEKQYGVLAQEVERIFPEFVFTGADSIKSVNYNFFIPILIGAVKQQKEKIDLLEKKLELLMQKIETLENNTNKTK